MLDEIEELKAAHRRWQQRERQGRPVKGPWPSPARDRVEPAAIADADRFPAWGHRKLAMLMRVDGPPRAPTRLDMRRSPPPQLISQ